MKVHLLDFGAFNLISKSLLARCPEGGFVDVSAIVD